MRKINDIRIARSALTDTIYAGFIAKDGQSWIDKVDVTKDFWKAVVETFIDEPRIITASSGDEFEVIVRKVK